MRFTSQRQRSLDRPADALLEAREMLARVAQLNSRFGETCRSRCGSDRHPFSARPSSVRWAAGFTKYHRHRRYRERLQTAGESTKEYDCAVIVSRRAAEMPAIDVKGRKLHQASVQGRMQTVDLCLEDHG